MPQDHDGRARQTHRQIDYDLASLRRAVVAERPDRETLAALVDRIGSRETRPEGLLAKARTILASPPPPPLRRGPAAASTTVDEEWVPAASVSGRGRPGRARKTGDAVVDRAAQQARLDRAHAQALAAAPASADL